MSKAGMMLEGYFSDVTGTSQNPPVLPLHLANEEATLAHSSSSFYCVA